MPLRGSRAPSSRSVFFVRCVRLALSAFFALAEANAWGQARPSTEGTASPIVEIVSIPSAEGISMLQDVLGPHPFRSASIRWSTTDHFEKRDVLRGNPEESDVTVRAWVDLSAPRSTSLYFAYFAHGLAERFLVRELQLAPAVNALDREALGQVLQLSVNALLEDGRGSLSRREAESLLDLRPPAQPPERPVIAPSPAVAPPVRPSFAVTAYYEVQAFAPQVPVVQGPGVGTRASVRRGGFTLALWLSGQYQLPVDLERQGIGVSLSAAALRAGVEGAVRLSPPGERRPWSNALLGLSLGGGEDLVRVTPLPGTLGTMTALASPYWSFDPVVSAALRVQALLLPHADLVAALLADVYLDPAHYDFRSSGTVSPVLAPFWIRPGVLVGLSIH